MPLTSPVKKDATHFSIIFGTTTAAAAAIGTSSQQQQRKKSKLDEIVYRRSPSPIFYSDLIERDIHNMNLGEYNVMSNHSPTDGVLGFLPIHGYAENTSINAAAAVKPKTIIYINENSKLVNHSRKINWAAGLSIVSYRPSPIKK